jgi:hypothetical protein
MFNCWLSQLKCDVGSTVTRDESWADGEDVSHYQLDIPPALMVSSNNLSVKINDGDTPAGCRAVDR